MTASVSYEKAKVEVIYNFEDVESLDVDQSRVIVVQKGGITTAFQTDRIIGIQVH